MKPRPQLAGICTRESDGEPLREIDAVEPPLVPFLYPEHALKATRHLLPQCRPRLADDHLPAIAVRVERDGLRPVARTLGVSHEALHATLIAGGYAALLANAGRKQRLMGAAPPPPPAPTKVPQERYGEVLTLCQRHTQAEVAARLGVSQTTIWRIVRRATRAEGRPPACPADA